jgi:hypothetical protein
VPGSSTSDVRSEKESCDEVESSDTADCPCLVFNCIVVLSPDKSTAGPAAKSSDDSADGFAAGAKSSDANAASARGPAGTAACSPESPADSSAESAAGWANRTKTDSACESSAG